MLESKLADQYKIESDAIVARQEAEETITGDEIAESMARAIEDAEALKLTNLTLNSDGVSFFDVEVPLAKQTVTGSDDAAKLSSLIAILQSMGLIG